MSKPIFLIEYGINREGTCLLSLWHPGYRWRELRAGYCTERVTLAIGMPRRKAQGATILRPKNPKSEAGADQFIVARKLSKDGGAKGLALSGLNI